MNEEHSRKLTATIRIARDELFRTFAAFGESYFDCGCIRDKRHFFSGRSHSIS